MEVVIHKKLIDYMQKLCDSSPFAEKCGLLLGKKTDNEYYISEVREVKNITKIYEQADYNMDPQEMMNILMETSKFNKNSAIDFVGIWHTHPLWTAYPSSIDINNVAYKIPYLITSGKDKNTRGYEIIKETKEVNEITMQVI